MKVFISWSGKLSQKIGEEIKNWIPAVLQSVKPYFTPSDIEKGSQWNASISKELEHSKIGIFIYTKDNLNSQWMLFEAGAISKTIDNSKVCPILFGIDNSDFKGPLTQFQTSQFNKIDFKKLIRTINNSLGNLKLEDKVFEEVFEMWWPKLENKINKILESYKVENISVRDDREIFEEVLALTRLIAKNTTNSRNSIKRLENNKLDKFEKLVTEFIYSTEYTFDWDWDHSKYCFEDLDLFVSENGTFLEPNVEDEGSDWANREGFLNSFRKLKSFMEDNNLLGGNAVQVTI